MSKSECAADLLKKIAHKTKKAPGDVLYEVLTGTGVDFAEIERAVIQWEIYGKVSRNYLNALIRALDAVPNSIHEELQTPIV